MLQHTCLPDAGPSQLSRLPRLGEISLDGLPTGAKQGTAVFPAILRAVHSS